MNLLRLRLQPKGGSQAPAAFGEVASHGSRLRNAKFPKPGLGDLSRHRPPREEHSEQDDAAEKVRSTFAMKTNRQADSKASEGRQRHGKVEDGSAYSGGTSSSWR